MFVSLSLETFSSVTAFIKSLSFHWTCFTIWIFHPWRFLFFWVLWYRRGKVNILFVKTLQYLILTFALKKERTEIFYPAYPGGFVPCGLATQSIPKKKNQTKTITTTATAKKKTVQNNLRTWKDKKKNSIFAGCQLWHRRGKESSPPTLLQSLSAASWIFWQAQDLN